MQFDAHQNIRLCTHYKSYRRRCSSGQWSPSQSPLDLNECKVEVSSSRCARKKLLVRYLFKNSAAQKSEQFKFLNSIGGEKPLKMRRSAPSPISLERWPMTLYRARGRLRILSELVCRKELPYLPLLVAECGKLRSEHAGELLLKKK